MLLTITTFSNANERYILVNEVRALDGGIWILDAKKGKVKFCEKPVTMKYEVECTKWKDLEDNSD